MENEQMPNGEAQPERSISAIPVKKSRPRRAARKPVVPKIEVKAVPAKSQMQLPASTSMIFVLFALLIFSGFNLYIAIDQYGSLIGLRQSWDILMRNYRTSSRTVFVRQPAPAPAPIQEKPAVLYSVVQGETLVPAIESMVVDPLIDYHTAIGNPLKGIYVERKLASSKVIRVHLFLQDGTDSEFLWNFTGKSTDWWIPDCGTSPEGAVGKPECPVEFLYRYPAIAQELAK